LNETASSRGSEPVYLTYFGADAPRERQFPVIRFADDINDFGPRVYPTRPRGGWFAISATHFQRVYLYLAGPWNEKFEAEYRVLRDRLSSTEHARQALPGTELLRASKDLELLEFGRLCHFLRNRPPLAVIGGSILLFHLSDDEVRAALDEPTGPLPPAPTATP
jgi:hypothetical protein